MQNQHTPITNAYHFISEGIILYLIVLPFMFYYYDAVPGWNYLLLLAGTCLLFLLFSNLTKSNLPYIVVIPVIILSFYLIGYTLSLSILFTGVLVWRYVAIRSKAFLSNEANYLIITFLLTLLGLFILKEFYVILFLFVQIFTILIGFTVSNLVVIEKEERRQVNRSVWLKWGSFFSIITILILSLADTATIFTKGVWEFFGNTLTLLVSGVAKVLEFLNINDLFHPENEEQQSEEIGMSQEQTPLPEFENHDGNFDIFFAIVVTVMLIFLLVIIYRVLKSKPKEENHSDAVDFMKTEEKLKRPKRMLSRPFKRRKVRIKHPIRKLVYEFEQKAASLELGRRSYESIENWFNRVGLEGNIDIYQKVRYGEQEVTTLEEKDLRYTLRELEDKLLHISQNST
ncbi:hypothetical protein [Ornithinibacillus xuwenensis]|uniref:DUF4129 domain-containing protein n=1 Tax=Ornithinibacillus xuwenensis TaxID=3144668 RepID=A0ABU9XK74_9BACI